MQNHQSDPWKDERQHVWSFCREWTTGEITAHTSGSTGNPKSIRLSEKAIEASVWRTAKAFGLSSRSHLHSCVSARFIGGKMMVARALTLNCVFTFEPPSNRPAFPAEYPIDLLAIVPSMVPHILHRQSKGNLPPIGAIIIGGAPLSQALRDQLASTNINAFETYGMTETASHVALRHVSTDADKPFTTLPGIQTATDSRGCLTLKVDGIDTDIVTNDLVRVINPREFHILGRADNVIVTGGMKTIPEEVERKISHLIPCSFFIGSRPSEKWGEMVVIVIDDPQGSGHIEEIPPEMANTFSSLLPPHERPRAIIRQPARHTVNGKLIRKI